MPRIPSTVVEGNILVYDVLESSALLLVSIPDKRVIAVTAHQSVPARASKEHITLVSSVELIIATPAVYHVLFLNAIDELDAYATVNLICRHVADD